MNKWCILIPTINGREEFLNSLLAQLNPQVDRFREHVEVIVLKDEGYRNGGLSIGEKRNKLHDMAAAAGATHISEIDDDDKISDRYVEANLPGVLGDYDCNSLMGFYYENGRFDRPFVHSTIYKEAKTNDRFYERPPNHLNVRKLSKVREIKYQPKNFGEDMTMCQQVSDLGLLETMYDVPEIVYHYYFRTKGADGI